MKSKLTGRFFGELITEYVDGNMWQLVQLPGKEFGLDVDGIGRIQPPDGFLFDFASIPAPAKWIYPKTGSGGKDGHYGPAAVPHDYLYPVPVVDGKELSREMVDRIFLLGMELQKVRYTMRCLFFMSVRVGGGFYFKRPDRLNKLRGTNG